MPHPPTTIAYIKESPPQVTLVVYVSSNFLRALNVLSVCQHAFQCRSRRTVELNKNHLNNNSFNSKESLEQTLNFPNFINERKRELEIFSDEKTDW